MSDNSRTKWVGGREQGLFGILANREDLKRQFAGQHIVTIATGITCAFLGDGRDVREYLVAADAVETLRRAGHVVHFLLFDDNLDPLRFRQLRVAVDKDPALLESFSKYCGWPLAHVPSPFSDNETYSQTFQRKSLDRLGTLGCRPNLVSSSTLYEHGAYRPYVDFVLDNETEIRTYLKAEFPNYTMDRVYHPVCEGCGRIDATRILDYSGGAVTVHCNSCDRTFETSTDRLRGKLSWKLDLALRWWMFKVDAEPFSKQYLEPKSGSFAIALSVARRFFGHVDVAPLLFGMVLPEQEAASHFFESLPVATTVRMFTDRWGSDLRLTRERVILEAGRTPVYEGESYLNVVKRHVPVWALDPMAQGAETLDLLRKGQRFARVFLNEALGDEGPNLAWLEDAPDIVVQSLCEAITVAIAARDKVSGYDLFDQEVRIVTERMGEKWTLATALMRQILGQTRGLPGRRLLYHLPVGTLSSVKAAAGWLLASRQALTSLPTELSIAAVKGVSNP